MSGPLSQQPGQLHPFFFLKSEPGKPLHISIRKKHLNQPWPNNEPDSGFTTIRQSVSNTHPPIGALPPGHAPPPDHPAANDPEASVRITVQSETRCEEHSQETRL